MSPCICPCDCDLPAMPRNPPGRSVIAYRTGDYASYRRALLTACFGEQALSAWADGSTAEDAPASLLWRPAAAGDLAVMMAEWWAYIADVLEFYNERLATQQYLGTADLPESTRHLIRLLGYRPAPGLAATATLAALVTPGQTAVLPKGLQLQNKPGPGQEVQTFELDADTAIGAPDLVRAAPPQAILAPDAGTLLLDGAVSTISAGDLLLLRPRDGSGPGLIQVTHASVEPLADKTSQTRLQVTQSVAPAAGLTAAQCRVMRAGQNSGLWPYPSSAAVEEVWVVSGSGPFELFFREQVVHLTGLARSIRPGDPVVLTAPGLVAMLASVEATTEAIWYANNPSDPSSPPSDKTIPPVGLPHTVLTLSQTLSAAWISAAGSVTVLYGWTDAAKAKNQPAPPWSGAPSLLAPLDATRFPIGPDLKLLLSDANGTGSTVAASSSDGSSLIVAGLTPSTSSLVAPFNVYPNLLSVTRGKTVTKEVLGSGQATVAGQSFTLKKSPVTYVRQGSGYVSTVAVTVDGRPWREVASFYGQAEDAEVFVTREDDSNRTIVSFGDGVNGARLPNGSNNVMANYRFGSGADAPPAGKLTVIAQPFPGLRAVRNPVAAAGGADPDPADQIRRYAPRSVLTFGRAVSIADYEAIAAGASGGARVKAAWAWDGARQRTAVTVYVGGPDTTVQTVNQVLSQVGDPNRPVSATPATAVTVRLGLTLLLIPGYDTDLIKSQVTDALVGADGLFSASQLGIGQSVFDSQISAACLGVEGVEAVTSLTFRREFHLWTWDLFLLDPQPLHVVGFDGGYFDLEADGLDITEVSDDL